MQRVQNRAARLVLKKRKRDYLALLLNELRWLPVKFRCEYNIATLLPTVTPTAHSLLNHIASLCVYQTSRSLRSSSEKILKMPKCSLKSVGWCSFSFIAPSAWNSLPASLRKLPSLSDFKSRLKTFLFNRPFQKSRRSMFFVYGLCVCIVYISVIYVCWRTEISLWKDFYVLTFHQ